MVSQPHPHPHTTADIEDAVIENEIKKGEAVISESEIETMTKKEKEDLINQIMDNGLENMTEYDKKYCLYWQNNRQKVLTLLAFCRIFVLLKHNKRRVK